MSGVGGIGPGGKIEGVEGMGMGPEGVAPGQESESPQGMNQLKERVAQEGQTEPFQTTERFINNMVMMCARNLAATTRNSQERIKAANREAYGR